MENLQDRAVAGPEGSSGVSISSRNLNAGYVVKEVKLQKLCEEDDIEHYLTTFERIAESALFLIFKSFINIYVYSSTLQRSVRT